MTDEIKAQMAEFTQPAMQAGLIRIILINTHLNGVVELKLQGHTNICGTNASGKTTLQRLIPVFYGEFPSRVVPATRDSFERWYLPTDESFIVYEYCCFNGQVAQAVLSSSGQGVNYRLIGKPFDIEDYSNKQLIEDGISFINMAELGRRMKSDGIALTTQLNTTQFRAILQNDRATLNSSANGRELVVFSRTFALADSGFNLRHIEKLAKAVHSKEGKMETIKAMIAAILEEDGVQPPTSGLKRDKVEQWISECQLIQGFEQIRPEFKKLEQCEQDLNQADKHLSQLRQQLDIDASKLAQQLVLKQGALETLQLDIRQYESEWTALRDELNQKLSAANGDIDKFEIDLEAIENEFDSWQAKDIETHQANLQRLSSWQNELTTAKSKYQLLTEKHQDIEASFERQKAEIQEKYALELDMLQDQKSELKDKLADQKSQEITKLQTIKDGFQQQKQQLKDEFQQQLHQLAVKRSELQSQYQYSGNTEQESSELALLDEQNNEASFAEDAAREQLRNTDEHLNAAKKQRDLYNKVLADKRKLGAEKEKQVEQIKALLYPGDHTLLEFLRAQQPEWETTIGKLIAPSLLQRNDLSPALAGELSQQFYGVVLDVDNIDSPEYALSEQALKNKLESSQLALEQALAEQEAAELDLEQGNEQVVIAEQKQSQARTQLRNHEASRKRLQEDKKELIQQFKNALSERKAELQKRLDNNQTAQNKVKVEQAEAEADLADQQREAEMDHQAHWQHLIDDTSNQIQALDLQIKQNKISAANDKKQLQQWMEGELAKRGVDIDEISQLKKKINELTDVIRITEQKRNEVKDYEHWYATVFTTQKVKWQQMLGEARKVAANTDRELNKKTHDYQQIRAETNKAKSELEQTVRDLKQQEHELQLVVKQLKKLKLPEAGLLSQSSTISQRIVQAEQTLIQRESLLEDIKHYVEHFDSLIAQQSGAGLSDTWETSRKECTSLDANGIKRINHRKLVAHLAQLLNVLVPQKLNGLREQGKIFGADLTSYYHVLADIDKRIGSQSTRISKEVEDELFLDGVSDSAVRIRSKISELEFWPELQLFDSLYQEWQEAGAHELPSQDYAQSMRRVMDIFGRSVLQGGISKLLDIELKLREGKSDLLIRTDRQLNESSSHGMAYLILCKFLLAFTRLLRGKANVVIHWPIDELGTLHQSNVKKIFDACQNNQISVVGAFPNPESEVLTLFINRYLIDKQKKQLQVVQPKVSPISARLKQKIAQNSEEA